MATTAKERRLSLRDIGEMAGTSASTVSRVLSGRGPVSKEAAERVLAAVRETGFVPNAAASALAQTQSALPGFLHNTIALADCKAPQGSAGWRKSYVISDAHEGVYDAAHELGIGVTVCRLDERELLGQAPPTAVSRVKADGLLVHPKRYLEYDVLRNVAPTVMYGTSTGWVSGFPVVEPDNRLGVASEIGYLYDLGHRRFEFVSQSLEPPDVHASYADRRDAFVAAMRRRACSGSVVNLEDAEAETIERYAADLAARPAGTAPTALVASQDQIASRILRGLAARGIRVPQEISVVGFDGTPYAEDSYPPLTTWSVDWHSVGRLALLTLVDLAQGKPVAMRTLVGGELQVRASTGPAPGKTVMGGGERECAQCGARNS